ncbi:MAG: hypothetical protein Q9204_001639 [Flavoplaca sp. TL-2023a]
MKTFVISAIAGAAIIGMHGVTAILGAEAAAIPAPDADSLVERQVNVVDGGCWQLPDGQVRCRADKRDEDELEKRQRIADGGCWQIPNGQIRCKADKPRKPPGKRDEDELEKRQKIVIADGGCWQLPDGQVQCRADKDKRDGLTETVEAIVEQ